MFTARKLLISLVGIALLSIWYFYPRFYVDETLLGAVESVTFNNVTYDFAYSDDLTDENLIIRLPAKNFGVAVPEGIGGSPVVPKGTIVFSVTNASGSDQNVTVLVTTGGKTMVEYLGEIQGGLPTKIDVTRQKKPLTSPNKKAVIGSEKDESSSFFMTAGETKYFYAEFRAAMSKGEQEEFYLEAFGDNNAYGHSF